MRIAIEILITLAAFVLAVLGLLYSAWPLIERILRIFRIHRHRNGKTNKRYPQSSGVSLRAWPRLFRIGRFLQAWVVRQDEEDFTQTLSHYEQLVKLMNDDPQVVEILLKKLAYQVPHQTEDWYCTVVLKQIQQWIENKLSEDADNPHFGQQQVTQYLTRYREHPSWWVYRKIARDYGLFKNLPSNFNA